ncbi:MAG: hypothetical protein U1B84_11620, partial [Variovorax sp.]|nr:hypothetical protein [Variovorax sp.]
MLAIARAMAALCALIGRAWAGCSGTSDSFIPSDQGHNPQDGREKNQPRHSMKKYLIAMAAATAAGGALAQSSVTLF